MNDLISRQAAIDLFPNDVLEWDTKGGYVAPHLVRRMIEDLPSAQSEPEEFEWCTDCKEYDQTAHCCHRWTKVIRNTVEELKQSTMLTKEEIKTIRIHIGAVKERLCNQQRWSEAEEYQIIIDKLDTMIAERKE